MRGFYFGMKLCITADMHFINNTLACFNLRRFIIFPIKFIIHHHGFRHIWRTIQRAKRQIFICAVRIITKQSFIPNNFSAQFFGIRVHKKLVWIKPFSFCRFIRSVNTIPVKLTNLYTFQINMPNIVVVYLNRKTLKFFASAFIKQTKFHLFGVC